MGKNGVERYSWRAFWGKRIFLYMNNFIIKKIPFIKIF